MECPRQWGCQRQQRSRRRARFRGWLRSASARLACRGSLARRSAARPSHRYLRWRWSRRSGRNHRGRRPRHKKSVVATTHVPSSSRHTAASSPVSDPTSRLAKLAVAGCPERRSRKSRAQTCSRSRRHAQVSSGEQQGHSRRSLFVLEADERPGSPARGRRAGGAAAATRTPPERRTFQRARLRTPTPCAVRKKCPDARER